MNRNGIYIRVLLVLIALVVLLAFVHRTPSRAARDPWLPSTLNPVGAGTMALFQTLDDLHWPVERWREPLSRLSTYGTGNTLVITRSRVGERVPFSADEITLLHDWVDKGNTLLLLGALDQWDDTRQMLREFGFTVADSQKMNPLSNFFHPLEPTTTGELHILPSTNQSGTLVLPPSDPLPAAYPSHAHVLWQADGAPYLLDVDIGSGHVICGASAQLLSKEFLGQGDNLAIVLHLLAPGGRTPRHLFFEESHHGFSSVFALARLWEHPGIRFGGMLALLGLLTFLGSSFVRFGPIRPLPATSGRSTLEFVDSIADLYQRADLRNAMIEYLFRETHLQILRHFNLPSTAPHALIATRLQQAYPQLPKWKKLAQRFDSRDYVNGLPPSGWLRVARDLIEIKSSMA
jgi:hypothetical protein